MEFAQKKELIKELTFQASRSGGPGGQNVNKVNTKITLYFDVVNSELLSEEEKEKIQTALENRMTKEGVLLIQSNTKRTQLANKEDAIKRFHKLINGVFVVKKKRKATKPTFASKKKRLEGKKIHSDKKNMRKKVDF